MVGLGCVGASQASFWYDIDKDTKPYVSLTRLISKLRGWIPHECISGGETWRTDSLCYWMGRAETSQDCASVLHHFRVMSTPFDMHHEKTDLNHSQ